MLSATLALLLIDLRRRFAPFARVWQAPSMATLVDELVPDQLWVEPLLPVPPRMEAGAGPSPTATASRAELRRVLNGAIELAQKVKHNPTPTRRQADLAADSVIMLANILRRLHEKP